MLRQVAARSANPARTGPPLSRLYSTVHDVSVSASSSSSGNAQEIPSSAVAGRSPQSSVLQDAAAAQSPRTDWSRDHIRQIYESPLHELTYAAATLHRRFHDPAAIQLCTLMNIKSGGCSEDCSYCAQSSRYSTGLKPSRLSSVDAVLEAAATAKRNGSTRFCMGAAWRDMRGRKTNLRNIKQMVSGVREMGMEVCVTLGMIDETHAKELKEAGLTAYNHNLDTSREFYPSIITTRSYDERLQTLQHVRDAGINVCSGGILGLGEADSDRVGLLHTAATLSSHPESFPVNALVPIKGTPLGDREMVAYDIILRTVATARLVLPTTIVRLAAGRISLSEEQQVACFQAGANAVFTGDKMLTTDCNGWDEDKRMFDKWGYYPMPSFRRSKFDSKDDHSVAAIEQPLDGLVDGPNKTQTQPSAE